MLLREVWEYEEYVGAIRTIDVTMNRIRDKIEKDKDTSSQEYKNLNTAKQYYEEQNTELKDLRKERDKAKSFGL